MKFTLDKPQGDFVFNNYGNGVLTVNDEPRHEHLLIFPDALHNWLIGSVATLTIEDFSIFIERRPDVIILGTGAKQEFPPLQLQKALAMERIQLDVMDTAAACRTYNLLLSEDRDVGAAVMVF